MRKMWANNRAGMEKTESTLEGKPFLLTIDLISYPKYYK
jgi:hypothetical protein